MSVAHRCGLNRFVTLTSVGDDWQTRRNRVKRLTHALSATHGVVRIVWCVEPNPAETGHHVHGLAGGHWIEHEDWSATADALGLGKVVTIERVKTQGAKHYLIKAGLYSAKGCNGGPADYGDWLTLAGGRGVHWSRRAFGGLTWPEAWTEHLSAMGWLGSDPGPWVRERADCAPVEYPRGFRPVAMGAQRALFDTREVLDEPE